MQQIASSRHVAPWNGNQRAGTGRLTPAAWHAPRQNASSCAYSARVRRQTACSAVCVRRSRGGMCARIM